jgi:hypothetical protein
MFCYRTLFHNADCVVGFEVLTAVAVKSTLFWDVTPCSPLKVSRRFGVTHHFHLQGRRISRARNQRERWQAEPEHIFTVVSYSAYSTVKMEAICSSETPVDFQRTIRRCIPEDSILQDRLCGLVVRVSGYRSRGPGFDSQPYHIF